MPPRIVISGYYGFHNIGDEAILAGMVAAFSELSPDALLTVLSSSPEETKAEHAVEAIPRTNLQAIHSALRSCDLFISGGGGLLQDRTSQKSLLYYLALLFGAKRLGCKTMIMGQGIGPLLRPTSRWLVNKMVSQADAVTVRDHRSALLLQEIIPESLPVEVTSDLAFALPALSSPLADPDLQLRRSAGEERKGLLGVSLRPWPGSASWLPAVSSALKTLSAQDGLHPFLIPFHSPSDGDLMNLLRSDLLSPTSAPADGSPPIPSCLDKEPEIAQNLTTPQQALQAISRTKVLVGMRLHSLIFAAMAGVPFLALAYDPKVESFAAESAMPCLSLTSLKAEQIVGEVRILLRGREERSRCLLDWARQNREKALRNVRLALCLLTG